MSGDYASLALIYDRVGMANFAQTMTPRLLQFAQQNDWLGRRVLDLGCGTGASVVWFAEHGYMVSGIDNSPEMLQTAQQKLEKKSLSAPLIESDIRTLAFDDRVDMVLALDVINELDSVRELETVFKNIHSVLSSGRVFIFDLHTTEGLAQNGLEGDRLLYDDAKLVVFARTSYDFERQIYLASYEIFHHDTDAFWRRDKAQRVLRAYPVQAVATLLRRQGFEVIAVVNTRLETFDLGGSNAPRVIFLAKKT